MTYVPQTFRDAPPSLFRMPAWVTAARSDRPEDVAFMSGAALSHLHLVLSQDEIPQAVLRARLALRAAEACVTHQGRPERAGELRDAVAFLQPGDSPGPAGEVYVSWQRAVARPVSVKGLHRALPEARAAAVLQAVLKDHPRDLAAALLLADAARPCAE